jgi:hypothetical protein
MKTLDVEKGSSPHKSPHTSDFASMGSLTQVIEEIGGAGRDRTGA